MESKGKPAEPFILAFLMKVLWFFTDRERIDSLLQQAWNPILAKYFNPEGQGPLSPYQSAVYPTDSPFSVSSFPPLTLDDIRYVLTKKLHTKYCYWG